MVDFYPTENETHKTPVANSGEVVKVFKKNGQFKITKTNLPSVAGIINLTATPTTFGYNISYDSPSDPLRDQFQGSLPTINPTLEIYDTDILKIKVNVNFANNPDLSRPMIFCTNTDYPYSGIEVGTLKNNIATSGEIVVWYPGVGNTGTYYYRWSETETNPIGGTITVVPTP
jgi:hypothetical protein